MAAGVSYVVAVVRAVDDEASMLTALRGDGYGVGRPRFLQRFYDARNGRNSAERLGMSGA